jgi:hypothetical protein
MYKNEKNGETYFNIPRVQKISNEWNTSIYRKDHSLYKTEFLDHFEVKELISIRRFKFVKWLLTVLSLYFKEEGVSGKLKYRKMLKELQDYNENSTKDTIKYFPHVEGDLTPSPFYLKNVVFGYTNISKQGRYYSRKSSVQRLSNDLRCLLFCGTYFDIDLRSSHLSIYYQYSVDKGFSSDLTVLSKYITDREVLLLSIAKELKEFSAKSIESDPLKDSSLQSLAINLLPNLKRKFMIYSNKATYEPQNTGGLQGVLEKYFLKFHNDMTLVRKFMEKDDSLDEIRIFVKSKTPRNFSITLQNFYAYSMENKLLDVAREKLSSEGFTSIIPMFDGLLVSEVDLPSGSSIADTVGKLNTLVKLSYPHIEFVHKPMVYKDETLRDLDITRLQRMYTLTSLKAKDSLGDVLKERKSAIKQSFSTAELLGPDNMEARYIVYGDLYYYVDKILLRKTIYTHRLIHPILDMDSVFADDAHMSHP